MFSMSESMGGGGGEWVEGLVYVFEYTDREHKF